MAYGRKIRVYGYYAKIRRQCNSVLQLRWTRLEQHIHSKLVSMSMVMMIYLYRNVIHWTTVFYSILFMYVQVCEAKAAMVMLVVHRGDTFVSVVDAVSGDLRRRWPFRASSRDQHWVSMSVNKKTGERNSR